MDNNHNLWLFVLIFISAAGASVPYPVPSPLPADVSVPTSPLVSILSNLGFQDLSTVAANISLSFDTPTTIFAPTDSSLLSCSSCSLPVLLQEHSVPGLYPLGFLRTLAFGTKLETLAPNRRCLTVTSTTVSSPANAEVKVFVNGAEITRADIFTSGFVIVHTIRGFVAHLSPLSCNIERMTSLSFPPKSSPALVFPIMRLMLKDVIVRLRISGYSVLALAMRTIYADLSDLRAMTIFALDDESVFGTGGHLYISDLKFHIVPNRLLMAADLIGLPVESVLPTMESGQKLVVTTAGGGGPLEPMRINYIKIRSFDLINNNRIVVHELSVPFPHVQHSTADGHRGKIERPESDAMKKPGLCVVPNPTAEPPAETKYSIRLRTRLH